MKRILAFVLLALSFAWSTPAKAQFFRDEDSARRAEKRQKAVEKAAEKQQKAMRKHEKAQRKAAKEAAKSR
jgi:hypothetical protein